MLKWQARRHSLFYTYVSFSIVISICYLFVLNLISIQAMKYMIKPLESFCLDYLLENLSAENVFTISQFCIDCVSDSRLLVECKKFIRKHTEAVLKAESFPKISHKCLTLLLRQNCLNVAEVQLFEAVCFFKNIIEVIVTRRLWGFCIRGKCDFWSEVGIVMILGEFLWGVAKKNRVGWK